MRNILEIKNLVVSYGGIEAVKGIDLTVEQGKVLNEELKHNIKDAIRENVTLHVVTPEDDRGEADGDEHPLISST